MDMTNQINSQRNRFLKLSLKKNLQKIKEKKKLSRSSDVIVLEDSFEKMNSKFLKTSSQKPFSPIVINESSDSSLDENLLNVLTPEKGPSKMGNVSFNCSKEDSPLTRRKSPSIGGWSPAQNIICATPRHETIPSTPKDVANESLQQCSAKKIEQSQKKILNAIYGEAWQSIPKLFKSIQNGCTDFNAVTKKLQFDDEESDKENYIKPDIEGIKKLYLTRTEVKKKVDLNNFNSENKTKRKLFNTNTPELPKMKSIKRDVNSTTKKQKVKKGLSVTELVEVMKKDVDLLAEKVAVSRTVENLGRLSFVGSLADNVPSWRCHPEALKYRDDYKNLREQLTRRLYDEFNRGVFENELDADMPIIWDSKLRSTAGTTTNRRIKNAKGDRIRTSSIKLGLKVLDAPARLRDTLVHEMCHAATWLVDGELRAGHGPLWKKWATRALKVYPELGEISRCHDMQIHFKYTYKCTKCGYSINRHSKSIDITKKCCGYCRGKFIIVLNKKNKDGVVVSTPARKGHKNDFALYVKENYGSVKAGRNHGQVMKMLGEQFSAKKKQNVDVVL